MGVGAPCGGGTVFETAGPDGAPPEAAGGVPVGDAGCAETGCGGAAGGPLGRGVPAGGDGGEAVPCPPVGGGVEADCIARAARSDRTAAVEAGVLEGLV